MRLSRLPLLAVMLIPSIVSAAENFMSSGVPYASPHNSQERDAIANQQEELIRQQDPNADMVIYDQGMVKPPADLEKHVMGQQNVYNPQTEQTAEQQKALGQALANYNRVLQSNNIDPNAAKMAHPEPQASYPPKPGSAFYDPNKNYSPETHYMPNN